MYPMSFTEFLKADGCENLVQYMESIDKIAPIPLKAYTDLSSFKIYMNDVGLLRRMAHLDSKIVVEGNRLFEEFKGALTENYILNMLNIIYDTVPNYYTFDRNEIDFMIQNQNEIIPIEVKSSNMSNHISLSLYNKKFAVEKSIIFSLNNLKFDGKILNIPLFLVEYMNKLIHLSF